MNVRPGDIARIVHPEAYGSLVLVHTLITSPVHKLTDGWPAAGPISVGKWEVEMLGLPIEVWRWKDDRAFREPAKFAACDDKWLRPIRDPGDDAVDEMLQRTGKPETAAIEWALGVRDVTRL
jgi:hypothetical protein